MSKFDKDAFLKQLFAKNQTLDDLISYTNIVHGHVTTDYPDDREIINTLACANDIDLLYFCGYLTRDQWHSFSDIADEVSGKAVNKDFLSAVYNRDKNGYPLFEMLVESGEHVPFNLEHVQQVHQMQRACVLQDLLYSNLDNLQLDVEEPKNYSWVDDEDEKRSEFKTIAYLILLFHGLENEKDTGDKATTLLLSNIVDSYYQTAVEQMDKKTGTVGVMGQNLKTLVEKKDIHSPDLMKTLISRTIKRMDTLINKTSYDSGWKSFLHKWFKDVTDPVLDPIPMTVQKAVLPARAISVRSCSVLEKIRK